MAAWRGTVAFSVTSIVALDYSIHSASLSNVWIYLQLGCERCCQSHCWQKIWWIPASFLFTVESGVDWELEWPILGRFFPRILHQTWTGIFRWCFLFRLITLTLAFSIVYSLFPLNKIMNSISFQSYSVWSTYPFEESQWSSVEKCSVGIGLDFLTWIF